MAATGSSAIAAHGHPANSPSSPPSARAISPSHTTSNSRRIRSSPGGSPIHTGSPAADSVSCPLPVSIGPAYVGETVSMTPTTETTVGIGGAAESTDMVLNIGPQHPSTHGVLRLRLVLDGERIQH